MLVGVLAVGFGLPGELTEVDFGFGAAVADLSARAEDVFGNLGDFLTVETGFVPPGVLDNAFLEEVADFLVDGFFTTAFSGIFFAAEDISEAAFFLAEEEGFFFAIVFRG
ncbi:MAG: hypothetical protein J6386_09425 [Candidatus Synoicihabitans palmerolidicus]|nr:hypothetical protein [Candidatus Synoicihabitans palmerolidicus]